MEAFLAVLLPRILDPAVPWKIIDYGSKHQLLQRLPRRLLGYSNYAAASRPKALVLVDRDEDDCLDLKRRLEEACRAAGLATRSRPDGAGLFDVVTRIVIEELEAWYFGDGEAVQALWPGTRRSLEKAAFRDPDAIRGGTHEAFLRVLQSVGYLKGASRLPKIETARLLSERLNVERNRSSSFQHFRAGLLALVANG